MEQSPVKQFGKAVRGMWYVLSFQLTPVPSSLPRAGFALCPLALQQPAVTEHGHCPGLWGCWQGHGQVTFSPLHPKIWL